MTTPISMNQNQFDRLVDTIHVLRDQTPFWDRLIILGAPVFLGAILGLAFGFLTDWLKTRHQTKLSLKKRKEDELKSLSTTLTAIAFNIESLIHTVQQQVIPHHDDSQTVLNEIPSIKTRIGSDKDKRSEIVYLINSKCKSAIMRSPEPYFYDINLFKEFPFLLVSDADLVKLSGWLRTYLDHVKYILKERNRAIDLFTLHSSINDFDTIVSNVNTQVNISNAEIVNCQQLMHILTSISNKLEAIIREHYQSVDGPKLKIQPPPILADVVDDLNRRSPEGIPEAPQSPRQYSQPET